MRIFLAPKTVGGKLYLAPAVAPPLNLPPVGAITLQPASGDQTRRFVGTALRATGGTYLLQAAGPAHDFGPFPFAVVDKAFDFTAVGIPAGTYKPRLTLTGPNGTAIIDGAEDFTIINVTGGGTIGVPEPSIVTGVTATPASVNLSGGGTQQVVTAVQGLNNPSQAGTWVKVSGVGTVSGTGAITAPASIATQQTGLFRFTSLQDDRYHVDVILTVAALPDDGGGFSYATHIFERFIFPEGIAQANLTNMHWYVFNAVGSQPFGSPLAQGILESTDGDGFCLIDITGQTSVLPGALVTLAYTNSSGDPDQANLISWFGTVRAL